MITFDLDYQEDYHRIPELLELLKKNNVKASFCVAGIMVERNKGILKKVIKQGHEIVNHTHTHNENFSKLTIGEIEKEIGECHKEVYLTLGYNMRGFRSPHFAINHNFEIYKTLKDFGYKYDSSTIGNIPSRHKYYVTILMLPNSKCPVRSHSLRGFCFSSHHCFKSYKKSSLRFWILFKKLARDNNYVNVYLDPKDLDDYKGVFKEIIESFIKEGFRIITMKEYCKEVKGKW